MPTTALTIGTQAATLARTSPALGPPWPNAMVCATWSLAPSAARAEHPSRQWCARSEGGAISAEGVVPADEDGLAKLVLAVGTDVKACVEMMSGAVWVRDRLTAAGWQVQVAHARKVRDVAPLA